MAAGYVAVSPTSYPVVTYVNPATVAANTAAKRTLDPQFIDGLVYATLPSGQTALVAAMYILPGTVPKAPMPYGALVQWHQRTNVCGPQTGVSTAAFDVTGSTPCVGRHGPDEHAVRDLGLAGPRGRRPAGHPATRHPDRGSGGDVGGRLAVRPPSRRRRAGRHVTAGR